jgi:hypothetical protein
MEKLRQGPVLHLGVKGLDGWVDGPSSVPWFKGAAVWSLTLSPLRAEVKNAWMCTSAATCRPTFVTCLCLLHAGIVGLLSNAGEP